MKRILVNTIAIVVLAFAPVALHAQTWMKELVSLNPDVIDSIVVVTGDYGSSYGLRSYHIYYHQPLCHAKPDGEHFQLRATLTTKTTGNPLTRLTQCYFSGYAIHEYDWTWTSYYVGSGDTRFEIAKKYNGNVMEFEHRFFGESQPKSPWLKVDYLNAEEAAADFHALIDAMKKKFTGKWVMNGISKGGATTAIQQAYYPEDFDLYVPYAGPLMDGLTDQNLMRHYTKYAWDENLRNRVLDLQRYALLTPAVFNNFKDWMSYWYPGYTTNYWKAYFASAVALIDTEYHAYTERSVIKSVLDKNDELLEQLVAKGHDKDELICLLFYNSNISGEGAWSDYISNNAKVRQGSNMPGKRELRHDLLLPLKFTESNWTQSDMEPYYYMALHEHGYFAPDFTCILYNPSEKAQAEELNRIWKENKVNFIVSSSPYMKNVMYDPSVREKAWNATLHNSHPMIYLYGQDDLWTGGGVPDSLVNNTETFKYILEAQNHNVCITAATQAERSELWDKIDYLLNIIPSDIEEVEEAMTSSAIHPRTIYNLQGQKIATPVSGKIYIVDGMKRVWK